MEQFILAFICLLLYLLVNLSKRKSNKLIYYVRFYSYYLHTVIVLAILPFILIWRGRNLKNTKLVAKFLSPMFRFNGITWRVENVDRLKTNESAVIISNHQQTIDILGLAQGFLIVDKLVITSKKELIYFGTLGLILYLMGAIFIDRKNPKEAYEILNKLAEDMKKEKLKVWLFPEGTRNKTKAKLLPLKKGAFTLAVAAQVPIIPVVYSPYYFIDEENHIFNYGGHVTMKCLDPVPTAGLTMDDVPELQERLHRIISDAYDLLTQQICTHSDGYMSN